MRQVSKMQRDTQLKDAELHILKFLLIAVGTLLFAMAWDWYYASRIVMPFYFRGNFVVAILFLVTYLIFSKLYGGLQVGLLRISELIYSQCIALLFTNGIMYVVICLLSRRIMNPLPLLLAAAGQTVIAILWSNLASRRYNRLYPPKYTIVVYGDDISLASISKIDTMPWKFHVESYVDIRNGLSMALQALDQAEAVFLCGLSSSDRNTFLKYCVQNGIEVYVRPKIGDLIISGSRKIHLFNVPILHCSRMRTSLWYDCAKRVMDLFLSTLGILFAAPFMIVTAIVIKTYDRGPVFYRQKRLTRNGKIFEIYKFRSMRVDAEKDGIARLASEKDDRITPVGKIIRAIRFDELPQLFNIFKGDMSIVGPRPERPEIAELYEEKMPEFALRLQVKAGLTGYAQVNGKYNTSPYDKLQMDLIYIAKPSIVEDFKLMLATIKILFVPESTEGVVEGQPTAMLEHETVENNNRMTV